MLYRYSLQFITSCVKVFLITSILFAICSCHIYSIALHFSYLKVRREQFYFNLLLQLINNITISLLAISVSIIKYLSTFKTKYLLEKHLFCSNLHHCFNAQVCPSFCASLSVRRPTHFIVLSPS